jgi:hypothetical protein
VGVVPRERTSERSHHSTNSSTLFGVGRAAMSQQGLEVGVDEATALNLRALQRLDKRITSITDTAMHVAVYRLQRSDQTWVS